jgi:ribosome-associated translation inhibitor RaiA
MRVHVLADESIGPQARTYAEYRVFAALTHVGTAARVRHACVLLRSVSADRSRDRVACRVAVAFATGEPLRIQCSGAHPYAAINRAVEQLRLATAEIVHPWPVDTTALL